MVVSIKSYIIPYLHRFYDVLKIRNTIYGKYYFSECKKKTNFNHRACVYTTLTAFTLIVGSNSKKRNGIIHTHRNVAQFEIIKT